MLFGGCLLLAGPIGQGYGRVGGEGGEGLHGGGLGVRWGGIWVSFGDGVPHKLSCPTVLKAKCSKVPTIFARGDCSVVEPGEGFFLGGGEGGREEGNYGSADLV